MFYATLKKDMGSVEKNFKAIQLVWGALLFSNLVFVISGYGYLYMLKNAALNQNSMPDPFQNGAFSSISPDNTIILMAFAFFILAWFGRKIILNRKLPDSMFNFMKPVEMGIYYGASIFSYSMLNMVGGMGLAHLIFTQNTFFLYLLNGIATVAMLLWRPDRYEVELLAGRKLFGVNAQQPE